MKMKKTKINPLLRLLKLVKPLWPAMLAAIFLGTAGHLAASFVTISAVMAAGKLFAGQAATSLLILVLICGLARGPLHYGEHYFNHLIAFKLLALLRVKLFHALRRLSPAKLEGKNKGELLALITGDIELLEIFYAHTISPVAIASLYTLCMVCFIGHYSWLLAFWALAFYLIVGLVIPAVNARLTSLPGQAIREKISRLSGFVLDSIKGSEEIRQFGQGQKRLENLQKADQELTKAQQRLAALGNWQQAATTLAIQIASAGMLVLSLLLRKHGMTLAGSLTVTAAMMSSFGPVVALSALSTSLAQTAASAQRVLDILDEEPVVSENESGEEPTFSQADLQKVTFTYPDGDQPVLKDFSLHIPKGKIIGIHAPSGSGKSTILKLLARFYDASEGQVAISGVDVKKLKTSALRQLESYVPQDTWLASETIEDNIKLGQAATRAEVIQAAKKASLHDFILTLPEGYDTKLGEGQQLSAGQKQRLGIARAFLHDGDLFLLDEITANLDALNEGIILKALKEESQDKTIVIVSHRLSTLAIADQIITL